MSVSENWIEVLRCPECASTAVVRLTQINDSGEVTVKLPEGFKRVSWQYGDTFYCVACERSARDARKTLNSFE